MKDLEDIQRLIGLKKYETPGDEYFQQFLEDFKDRQRGELLRQSARGLLFERVAMWFGEISTPRWLVPAGASAAALALGVYAFSPSRTENGKPGITPGHFTSLHSLPLEVSAADTTGTEDESVITLQLPRPDRRVPGLDKSGPRGAQGLLPASSGNMFREL
jgi:hypothetical protein